MIRKTTFIIAAAGLAATASAQAPGDILFATNDRSGGSDTIQLLNYASLTPSLYVTFPAGPESSQRLIGGIDQGPSGEFYFANWPTPEQNPSTASILRVDNMFNAGTRATSTFFTGDPVQGVEGLAYDPLTNNLLMVNNPGSAPVLPLRQEGVLGIDLGNPASATVVVPQPLETDPLPRPVAFNIINPDRLRANNYYIGAVNGGVDSDPMVPPDQSASGSIISRLVMNNAADPTDVSFEILVDLSESVTGLDRTLSVVRGIASADNGNLYVAEQNTRSIYEVVLDGNGDYVSIAKILDLDTELDAGTTGIEYVPFGIIYNEFTGKLNYIERNGTAGDGSGRIVELNLDGTGRTVLLDGIKPSVIYAVPAPMTAALLGLAGLTATRRRR